MRAAARRGITHLAITDHDRIDGALGVRDAAPAGLTVIVGQEVRTSAGDLIALFVEQPVPPGLPLAEAAQRIRDQGGAVGLAHPYDRFRAGAGRPGWEDELELLLPLLDYDLIRRNPKILMGYSDITALLNGIHARTGLVTFHGPNAGGRWDAYSVDAARRVLFEGEAPVFSNPPTASATNVLAPSNIASAPSRPDASPGAC